MIIAPSLLAADFKNLSESLSKIKSAPWLHLDVMDGHFVPNLSFGPDIIKTIRPLSNAFFDTHLMVENPEALIDRYIEAGSDQITFHIEAVKDPRSLIKTIKSRGVKVGLSLKPGTDLETITPYLNNIDLVLVMSVEPGFGGQSFMDASLSKIKALKNLKDSSGYAYLISVDGGIDLKSAPRVISNGADVLVSGSAIFNAESPEKMIEALRGH
jgi:ribulose-phosphate 3-epimerase